MQKLFMLTVEIRHRISLHISTLRIWLGGLVTIIGSDGNPTQVPANSLQMPGSAAFGNNLGTANGNLS